MGRLLITTGLVLIIAGLIVVGLQSLTDSGRGSGLPGDFVFRRGNVTFYFPVATSIIVSIVLSVILYLFFGMRR